MEDSLAALRSIIDDPLKKEREALAAVEAREREKDRTPESAATRLKKLKENAVDILEAVLTDATSEDVRRKAAVDILSFTEKTKHESPVTEEQLGWLGRVLIETEAIRERESVSKS